jgi:hypothetical protein
LTIGDGDPSTQALYRIAGGELIAGAIERDEETDEEIGFTPAQIINNDRLNIEGPDISGPPAVIRGNILNNKTFNIHDAHVRVDNLEFSPSGYMTATLPPYPVEGIAKLIVTGDLIIKSTQSGLWDTGNAQLEFTGGEHQVMLAGIDRGPDETLGPANNFYWGDVNFGGGTFTFLAQEDNRVGALYAGTITPNSFSLGDDSKVIGFGGDSNIYYSTYYTDQFGVQQPLNDWLGGQTYNFASGNGAVIPMKVVPEPVSSVLFLLGAGALAGATRKRKK